MDATYLKTNVMSALTEGLTAMSIKTPDDQIEFLGNYLKQYVERKKKEKKDDDERKKVEANLTEFQATEDVANRILAEKNMLEKQSENKNEKFIASLTTDFTTKPAVMEAVANFIEESYNIPAAYIAIKKTVGEVETLHYLAASQSQAHVVGKKLVKVVVDESDENPAQRQGISFDSFKVPEASEEEPAEEVEGEERPPKIVLKPQPLVVENTMREKRIKFFGIPKLGAFVAVPFAYQSIDHDAGCVLSGGGGEEGAVATYGLSAKETQFIIGVDSIGKYRLFKVCI